jgi:hypothetical protein
MSVCALPTTCGFCFVLPFCGQGFKFWIELFLSILFVFILFDMSIWELDESLQLEGEIWLFGIPTELGRESTWLEFVLQF